MNGFDLGLVNMTSGGAEGVQWGAVSIVNGEFKGWQGNWIVSITKGNFEGLQTGLYNQAKHVKGLQLGLVNQTEHHGRRPDRPHQHHPQGRHAAGLPLLQLLLQVKDFRARYGPWALVTGASEGIGESFARALASRGLNLLLVARREGPLEALAAELRTAHGVQVRTAAADVARPDLLAVLDALAGDAEVGLVVHNAAFSALGPFLDRPLDDLMKVIDVNCRAPLAMAHHFGAEMVRPRARRHPAHVVPGRRPGHPDRGRLRRLQGLRDRARRGALGRVPAAGVDVLACRAGPTRTPSYEASRPRKKVPMMEAGPVVEEALAALGQKPVVVAGRLNRAVNFVMQRLLSRPGRGPLHGHSTRKMYE